MNPKQKYISSVLNPGASNPSASYRPQTTLGTTPVDSLMGKSSSYSNIQKKQPTPVTPANTSATSPATPKITSPAGQAYVSAQVNQPATPAPSTPLTAPSTPSYQDTPDYKAYLSYTRNKENPSEAELARKQYEASMKRLVDAQNERERAETEARKGVEKTLTTGGGLRSGTQAGAGVYQRRAGEDVADLSLAESAAARSAGVALDVYDPYRTQQANEAKQLSIEEATTLGVPFGTTYGEAKALGKIPTAPGEAFNLSEGQARYDANGNLIAQRGKTYAPGTGGSGAGGTNISETAQNIIALINQGANIDDLIKGTSQASQNLRNEVFAGMNEQGGMSTRARELFTEAKNAVDKLLEGGYKALGGYSTRLGGQFTTAYGDAQARAQQLEAILARDNLGLLKGAMSDKDLAFIQSMSSGFKGEGVQSEDFIKGRLEEIQTKLDKRLGTSGTDAPVQQMQLPDGTIVTLQSDGTYQ